MLSNSVAGPLNCHPEGAVRGYGLAKPPPLTLQFITDEPRRGTADGELSPPAKTYDLVRLDRLARYRLELYHFMAVTQEDAGYRDGRASVGRRRTKLSITTPIMHLPPHRPIQLQSPQSLHCLNQCMALRRGKHLIRNSVTLPRQYSKGPSFKNQLTTARVGMRQPFISR
jgi:hypothetical protein